MPDTPTTPDLLARMREVLRPFAASADWKTREQVFETLCFFHFDAARALLRDLDALASLPAGPVSDGDVTIPKEVAELIAKVFLPANPNKMRNAAPETVAAVKAFKAAVEGRR